MRVKYMGALVLIGLLGSWGCASEKAVGGAAGESGENALWTTNYEQALVKAGKEGKRVLLDFSGSDWCGWCKRLDREIFSTEEFKSYAKKNLVLVLLDFPRRTKLAPELQKQNAALGQKYGVRGYPTLIVLNSSGKRIGKMGYMRGGPEPFLEALGKIQLP